MKDYRPALNQQLNQSFTHLCNVCCQQTDHLYQLANCGHYFCLNCSLNYIQTNANSFNLTKCLQDGCDKKLDKSKPVYKKLKQEVIKKIKKYEQYQKFTKNPQQIPCNKQDCFGVFSKKQNIYKCNQCQTIHCKKCLLIFHEGDCKVQQGNFQSLNFKKCPNCRVWVQKSAGCQYIFCKCKTSFCYKCGNEFNRDPCRKSHLWKMQNKIKKTFQIIKIQKPENMKQWLSFVPLLILKCILSVVLVFLTLSIIIALAIGVCLPLTALASPFFILYSVLAIKDKKKIVYILLLIIFYPFLVCLFFGLFCLAMIVAPLSKCFQINHNGVLDFYENGTTYGTFFMLKMLSLIWKN